MVKRSPGSGHELMMRMQIELTNELSKDGVVRSILYKLFAVVFRIRE